MDYFPPPVQQQRIPPPTLPVLARLVPPPRQSVPPGLVSPPALAPPVEQERPRTRLPAWIVSMLLHMALILTLALIPFAKRIVVPFVISGTLGTQDATMPFEISNVNNSALEESELSVSPTLSTDFLIKIDSITNDTVEPALVGVLPTKSASELSLSGRTGSLKATLLAAYGGTAGTEQAVEEGLAWLVRQQRSDGSWSLRGPYLNGGLSENKTAATAMALIALAGAGNTHLEGTHKSHVKRGLEYLVAQQNQDGFFNSEAPERQQMYGQGQATIALCELYGMSGDKSLRGPSQLAVEFADKAQSREGGWRYVPREDSDTSVTGWFVMALMSGRMAGLSTERKTLAGVDRFLDSVESNGGSEYSYTELARPSVSMSAEGLLCREYLGWKRDDERLVKGCELLTNHSISNDVRQRAYYNWYYTTQTLHHYGGEPWQKWNLAMRVELPRMQIMDGKDRGSWPPQGDDHATSGGRLFSTCFALYCLEVYYRHLPLYGVSR